MDKSLELDLTCDRCGAPITIIEILLKLRFFGPPTDMVVVGRCPERHKKKFRAPIATGKEAISVLESHILKCSRCDQPITFKIAVKEDSHAKFKIICSDHGAHSCTVPINIYNELSVRGTQTKQAKEVRKRLTEADKVGIAGLIFGGISLVHLFVILFILPNRVAGLDPGAATGLYIGTGAVAALFCLLGLGLPLKEHVDYERSTTVTYTSMAFNGTLLLAYIILLLIFIPR